MKKRLTAIIFLIIILLALPQPGYAADADKLENARQKLTFANLTNESINSVTQDLVLPVVWEDCFVVWETENENLLEIVYGKPALMCQVIRPPFGEGAAVGILRATLIDGERFAVKNFALNVPENDIGFTYSSDILKAKDNFEFEFLGSQNIFAIRENLIIPESPVSTVTVSAESQREDVLTKDGAIKRNAQKDETAYLTVTFENKRETLKKSYPVIIKALDEDEVRKKLHEDIVSVKNDILEKYNTALLTENLSFAKNGKNGSAFTWSSSDENVIKPDGTIVRAEGQAEAVITITAALSGLMETEHITVTVAAKAKEPHAGGASGSGESAMATPPQEREPVTEPEKGSFDDVPKEHWAFEAIETMKKENIIDGIGGRRFAPDSEITREQAVKLIVRSLKVESRDGDNPFTDVPDGAWYKEDVLTAYHAQIIRGMSGDRFGTGAAVTRQDFAVMLCNAMRYCSIVLDGEESKPFSDDGEIAPYAENAVYALCAAGLLQGMPDGSFQPKKTMTRAETAVALWRCMER